MTLDSTHNALRRLIRCLFAERILDPRALRFGPEGHRARLPLCDSGALHFEDLRRKPAGTFVNHGAVTLVKPGEPSVAVETPDHLINIIRRSSSLEITDESAAALNADIANSIANDRLARSHRHTWNAELARRISTGESHGLIDYLRRHHSTREAAILLDQWGSLEGHPFYPTWKTKPALSTDEMVRLSPEFGPTVPVRIAALRADMAYVEQMPHVRGVHEYFATRFPQAQQRWKDHLNARGLDETAWLPLPIHSWHLENFVRHQYRDEVEAGLLLTEGPDIDTRPTMSFRTMLPTHPGGAPFIKLPVALWMTSEQRSLQAKSIHMGPRICTVIERILAAESGFDNTLEIFNEELAYYYRNAVTQEDAPGRYLSVVFRDSTAITRRADDLLPVPVAALFTESPTTGRPLVTELIVAGSGRATAETVESFYRRYARTVLRPVISIYLLYGIGLEAHQQNTFVLFDAGGRARSLLIRDFGDGQTFAPLLNEGGHTLQPYRSEGILPTVFTDSIDPVRSFVINACLVPHLHELAMLLADEYGLSARRLRDTLRDELLAAFDAIKHRVPSKLWRVEREAFAEQPWPTRSFLRMHLTGYANYRLRHELPNPLVQDEA
ncbi:IucA/IucC family siderophore biosynthesis protein [Micromonospora sp. HUAS LYJ1]|uniref:IucA/IucC family protein n=1 Tax=Micromonospora sp. HUAS LYJ1 TaxID=3061626 RepID=UPI0026712B50|nr:IucA/IucC family protein [Micromonospora sp. HUAS LYJ1]WKU05555.1 IucA/IucC family protein [Micromonospora sp. HUAS LYJ1]